LKRSRSLALLTVAAILILGSCGGEKKLPFNATPTVSNLFPSVITAGSDGFTLSVDGSGFVSGSMGVTFVNWNGSPRSTSFNSNTGQLSVQIFASDILTPNQVTVTATNPPPGGGTPPAGQTFTIEPGKTGLTLVSLDPNTAKVGDPAFMITANGTGFMTGDVVTWNGTQLITNVSGPTQVTAQVTADLLTTAGTASVSVATADPTVATKSQTFTITGQNNPAPKISSLSPNSATHGAADLQVRVDGSGFVNTSTVEINGNFCATAFVSSSELVALVQAANLATAGTAQITVVNPAPGGGASGQESFTIN
jgi:hypothetical protein